MNILHATLRYACVAWLSFATVPQAIAANADDSMANEILVYINQYRSQHGLSRLTMNPILSQEAAQHSQDMARHALPFGHDGFSSRMDHLHHHVPNATNGAENVAYNYKTAKIVADGWIKSPGHRQNIVGHYNQTGIGIARDSQGKLYYTQLFLRTDTPPIVAHATRHRHPTGYLTFGGHQHGHYRHS